jgi:Family of unknown function (DUF6157)
LPPQKNGAITVAGIHYEMMAQQPYHYTSDDVVFMSYAIKNNISKENLDAERERFFLKGQPCLRCSPLGKRYGWGIHSNAAGKLALYAVDSPEYRKLAADKKLKHVKAMRTKKG